MKRFIIRVILFTAALLAIVSAFVYPLTLYFEHQAFISPRPPYVNMNRVDSLHGVDADLIILGNSRGEGHYSDTLLSALTGMKCLNLGLTGFPFNYQYHIMYEPYIQYNKAPKVIIQDIGPWAFFGYAMPKYSIEMTPYITRPNYRFLRDICPEISYFDQFRLIRYTGRIGKVIKELKNLSIQPEEISQEYRKGYVKHQEPLECDTAIIHLFSQFIDECEQRNIRLVLICSPIHGEDGLRFFDMEGFWRIIGDVTRGKNVEVWNLSETYSSDTSYFRDAMHLNNVGMLDFTRQVAEKLSFAICKP